MSKVLSALIAKTGKSAADFRSNSKIGEIFRTAGVQRTPEFERILRLPKRKWEDLLKDNYLETLSAYLRTPNGTQTLRPAQAALLTEAVDYGGAIGALGLGQGKTLLLGIAPTLMSCQRPIVLIPANLRGKTARDFKILRQNWLVHPKITCISYETLGLVKNANLLEELNPDGIFADECFVADTKVQTPDGQKSIQDIKVGDKVLDQSGLEVKVEHFWHSTPTALIQLSIANEIFVCTPNHPFLTDKGWTRADKLEIGSKVMCISFMQKRFSTFKCKTNVLHKNMCRETKENFSSKTSQASNNLTSLQLVRDKHSQNCTQPVLFRNMQLYMENDSTRNSSQSTQQGSSCENQCRPCETSFRTSRDGTKAQHFYEIKQSDGKSGNKRENFSSFERKTVSDKTWRYGERFDGASTCSVGSIRPRMDSRTFNFCLWEGLHSLYSRYLPRRKENRCGSRWDISQYIQTERERQDSRRISCITRLESVSSIEPRRVEQDGRNSKVYNIQVSGSHTYLVGNGVIVHNCQMLRNLKAARTKNVRRFKKKHPEVPMVFLSGTPWSRSLKDLWHLFLWALPADFMPLPRNYTELQEWCCAVDEKIQPQDRVQAGALLDLAKGVEEELGVKAKTDLERARLGLQRRIKSTAGYVATVDSGVEASITIEKVKPPKVKAIDDALQELRDTWCTPNGEELDSALAIWQYAQTLACGFYYKWNPPPPKSWKIARKSWSRYVRKVLEHSQNWQSPLHVSQGVLSGKLKEPHKETHPTDPEKTISTPPKELLANWQREHAAYKYKKEAIWIDTTRMQWVVKNYLLNTKKDPIICWMMHTAVGEKLSELSGLPFCHTAGKEAKGRYIEDLEGSIIASIHTCGKGTNLQGVNGKPGWYRNLVLEWPTKGETCEQLMGRTHRSGQKEGTVEFLILDSCQEQDNAFEQSLKDAQLQASLGGDYRRLLMADKI